MKKILFLMLSLILTVAIATAGTWAYFTDTQVSTNNVFAAGTLNLQLDSNGGTDATDNTTATFGTGTGGAAAIWGPGDNITNQILNIKNAGSLAMTSINVTFTYGTNAANDDGNVDITGRAGMDIPLNDPLVDSDKYDKMIFVTSASYNGTAVPAIANKSLFTLKAAGPIALPAISAGKALPANDSAALVLNFKFDDTATNGCQGNLLTMKVTVTGTQN